MEGTHRVSEGVEYSGFVVRCREESGQEGRGHGEEALSWVEGDGRNRQGGGTGCR